MPKKKAPKAKKPRNDFAQNALATVLRLTGSKSLVPDKVVPVDFKRKGK